jgi:hypothetical protein
MLMIKASITPATEKKLCDGACNGGVLLDPPSMSFSLAELSTSQR